MPHWLTIIVRLTQDSQNAGEGSQGECFTIQKITQARTAACLLCLEDQGRHFKLVLISFFNPCPVIILGKIGSCLRSSQFKRAGQVA